MFIAINFTDLVTMITITRATVVIAVHFTTTIRQEITTRKVGVSSIHYYNILQSYQWTIFDCF